MKLDVGLTKGWMDGWMDDVLLTQFQVIVDLFVIVIYIYTICTAELAWLVCTLTFRLAIFTFRQA